MILRLTGFFILFSISFAFGQNKPGKEVELKISKISPTAKKSLPLPIIDMHMHANKANFAGPPPIPYCIHGDEWPIGVTGANWLQTLMTDSSCKNKLLSEKTDEDLMNKTFAIMKRRNVYAVASGVLTEVWKAALPDRIIPSLIYRGNGPNPSIDSVRKLFNSGRFKVFGEIMAQYGGIPPDDPSLDPYWAVLQELNMPLAYISVHRHWEHHIYPVGKKLEPGCITRY